MLTTVKLVFLARATFILMIVTFIGDYIVPLLESDVLKALIDNIIHGTIGSLSWIIIVFCSRSHHSIAVVIYEVMLCGSISSFIDSDHFVMAGSTHLYDATHLSGRPYLHCTTILFIPLILYIYSLYLDIEWMHTLSWIFFVSMFTHHIRDGIRRGLWFCPAGSTPLIPYEAYIVILVILPFIVICYSKLAKKILPLHTAKTIDFAPFIV